MAVKLSSYRVSAVMDAAGYTAGMAQKIAADKAGAASAVQVGAAIAANQNKVSQAGDVLTRLSRNYVEGFGAAERFTRAVNTLGRGIETGNVPMERADAILDGIYRKFGMTADASELAAAGHDKLAGAVERLNARFQATAQLAERAAQAQQRSAAANFQTGINSSLGVRDDFATVARGADVAAYGAELDRLRAKYNPLFSVIRQYRAEIADVRQANLLGAISEDEMTAAINRQRTAALAAIDALKNRNVAAGATSARGGSFQTANIAAQFQDIAVTGAMPGSNPLQIALQQGNQLSAVFQQMKSEGQSTALALASAFGSVVSPLSLITIGVIAVGVAGAQWLVSMIPKVKTADEALKAHADIVERIKTAYDEALSGVERYTRESPALLGALSRKSVAELEVSMRAEREKVNQFNSVLFADADGIFRENFKPKTQFAPFAAAIETLRQQMADGKPDFEAFYASINQTVDADGSLRKVGDELITSTAEARQLAMALADAARQAQVLAGIANTLPGGGNFIAASFDALDASKSAQAFNLQKDAITALGPAQQGQIAFAQKMNELSGTGLTYERMLQEAEQARTLATLQGQFAIGQASQQRLRALNDNVAAQQLELDVVGKSVEETERLQFARQNLAAAEAEAAENGTTVSAAYRAEVERLAAAYGKLQQQIALRKLGDDLQFDRDQLFRSPIEQTVASTLRPIFGNDLTSSQALFAANQIRINEQLKQFDDIGSSVTSGFLSTLKTELSNGASLWAAFADTGANALQTIADKALSMAADGIWDMIFGALKSSLFGGGGFGGTSVNPTTGLPALFADGGFTGVGSKYQPAGIVHRGEYVFSAGAVQRIGLANLDRLHGYADGGLVGRPSGISAANGNSPAAGNDNWGSLEIHNHIHVPEGTNPETAPAIAREVAKELKAQLPDAIQSYNRNPRRRAGGRTP